MTPVEQGTTRSGSHPSTLANSEVVDRLARSPSVPGGRVRVTGIDQHRLRPGILEALHRQPHGRGFDAILGKDPYRDHRLGHGDRRQIEGGVTAAAALDARADPCQSKAGDRRQCAHGRAPLFCFFFFLANARR